MPTAASADPSHTVDTNTQVSHPSQPNPGEAGKISIPARKAHFIQYFLKEINRINADILSKRARLLELIKQIKDQKALDPAQQQFVDDMMDKYQAADINDLLKRINIIPPSLAIAQAAVESSWGRDPKALRANVFFGQKGWTKHGTVRGAPGERYAGFASPAAAAEAYIQNLNTHDAYTSFRNLRARLADTDKISGLSLAPSLQNYSIRGPEYTKELQSMITQNGLNKYDINGP